MTDHTDEKAQKPDFITIDGWAYQPGTRGYLLAAEVIRLDAQVKRVQTVLNAMGDPTDPRHLHPQTASLMLQIEAALHEAIPPGSGRSDG